MPTMPDKIAERLAFFELHLPVWAANPTAIGLTAIQVADLATRTASARTAFDAAQNARSTAKATTVTQTEAMGDMSNLGGDLIKTIRAFAETTNDVNVYSAAQIPPPAPPTPTGPPDVPTNIDASINNFGEIKVNWKASRAVGTQFIVQRQLKAVDGTLGNWSFAGSSVTNDYTDTTVPTGFAAVNYRVYAQRPGGQSDASITVTLNFGTGAATTTAAGDTDLTIAA
jgi:hypothetical protein